MKKIRFALLIVGFMAVTACGGGGGGGAATSAAPGSDTASTPAAGSSTTPAAATTGTAKLAWDAPAGSSDVRGFKVSYGTVSGTYTKSVDVGTATTCTIDGLAPGRYYFVVAAYDGAGSLSNYSNEVTKDI